MLSTGIKSSSLAKKLKKILICDEAEQLEDMLSGELSLNLKESLAKKIGSDVLQKQIHEINLTTSIEDIKQIIDALILEYNFGIEMLESSIAELKATNKKWHHKHKEKKDYANHPEVIAHNEHAERTNP